MMVRLSVFSGALVVIGWMSACGGSETVAPPSEDVAVNADVVADTQTVKPDVAPQPDTQIVLDTADTASDCEPGEGCFGETCSTADECLSGICGMHLGENVCSKTCDEECPKGWSCRLVNAGGDGQYVCVSDYSHLCLPCANASDCSGDDALNVCVGHGEGGSFCGGACDVDTPCPEGYACQEVTNTEGGLSYQCMPVAGVCPCSALASSLGLGTPCEKSNAVGTCEGYRLCTASGLSACDAKEAAVETCNGIDDDCNGQIDENTCDDGNPCTVDTCAGEAGCQVEPISGGECIDGSACTQTDHCEDGVCVGTEIVCDDDEVCTDDACDPAFGCVFTPNFETCDDGNGCTLGDTCKNGECAAGPTLACDDNNPCTNDDCGATGCVFTPNESPCDDGNACSADSTCMDAVCVAGSAIACDDGNPCTDDGCEPATGCISTNNAVGCSDADPCTLGDQCADGVCKGGDGTLSCDDGNPCTDDYCGDVGCVYVPNDAPCEDNNPCTASSVCKSGSCVATQATACDDNNPCTTDACDPSSGCTNEPNTLPCSDNNACTIVDTCTDGKCVGANEMVCSDGNPCTDDGCNSAVGCTFQPNENACDDLNTCTTGDVCASGSCAGQGDLSCDDGNPCTVDSCKLGGGCTHVSAEGAACSDGDGCTLGDTCAASQCVAGPVMNCDDGNPCTEDVCQPGVGCLFEATNLPCDDGNACTTGDVCDGGACTTLGILNCADNNPCTDDGCDPDSGCVTENNSNACEDGNACTINDGCADGDCQPGEPLPCDDGKFCNGEELCDAGVGCVSGPPPSLSDGIACTSDVCDEATDSAKHLPQDNLCNEGGVCKTDFCDVELGCQQKVKSNCCGNAIPEDGEGCDDGNQVDGDGCTGLCQIEAPKDCQAVLADNPNADDGMYLIDPDGIGGFEPFMAHCVMTIEGGGWTRFNWLEEAYPAGKDPLEFEVAECDPNGSICRGRIPKAADPKEFMVRDLTEGTFGAWQFDGSTISNAVLDALHKKIESCHKDAGSFSPYNTNSLEAYCANGGEDGCDSFYYTSGACVGVGNWGIHWDGDNHWCAAVFKMGATKAGSCGDGDYGFMDYCDCSDEKGALYYR